MLSRILSSFLKLSEAQAQALTSLLSMEERFSEEQEWRDAKTNELKLKMNPDMIQTREDFISFLQALGQSKWFKGHDRSKFPATVSDQKIKDLYFQLFEQMGFFNEITIPADFKPDYAVVLGSGETQVKMRTDMLIRHLKAGILPCKNKVFGLGSNRTLGTGVLETEAESKTALQASGKPETEMEMVNWVVKKALSENNLPSITYQAIDTLGAPDRSDPACVKTADTAASFKETIEQDSNFSTLQKPIKIMVFSAQPFVERQVRDVQNKLGPDYLVVGAGTMLPKERFDSIPIAINIVLGELARLVNTEFTTQKLEPYRIPLTQEEKTELQSLIFSNTPVLATSIPQMLLWVADENQFKKCCDEAATGRTRDFIECLKEYKATLSGNNAKYNVKSTNPEQLALLDRVKNLIPTIADEEAELKAAAFNLQALIERDITKDYEAAIRSFNHALEFGTKLQPRSIASLFTNLARTYNEMGKHQDALELQKEAAVFADKMNLSTKEDRHAYAAVYSGLGYACRKTGDQACFDAFTKSLNTWPDLNVIQNNAAIALSKIDSDSTDGLKKAEDIFQKNFEKAVKNKQFVNPFYRADVNIKLASRAANEEKNKLLETAQICLAAAKEAIDNPSSTYTENYKTKAQSRMKYLEGHIELVRGNVEEASSAYEEAKKLRFKVTEPDEKRSKFFDKIPNTSAGYHSSMLFRRQRPMAAIVANESSLVPGKR